MAKGHQPGIALRGSGHLVFPRAEGTQVTRGRQQRRVLTSTRRTRVWAVPPEGIAFCSPTSCFPQDGSQATQPHGGERGSENFSSLLLALVMNHPVYSTGTEGDCAHFERKLRLHQQSPNRRVMRRACGGGVCCVY